jgi:hypothetical protein
MLDFKKHGCKIVVGILVIVVALILVFLVWKPFEETASYGPTKYYQKKRRETFSEGAEIAEIAPIGTQGLDGDIPGHISSVNDPTFLTTPSIVLSTTSRIGENLSYKNVTTDIRGSVPRVMGGSGSTFNQNLQSPDTTIDPDSY